MKNEDQISQIEAEMSEILASDDTGTDHPVPATIEELEAEMARIMGR